MRIVVIGATGLIGARLVERLRQDGHEGVAASRSTGVDVLSRDHLRRAMAGAEVALEVLNPPAAAGLAAPDFFRASGDNIAAAGRAVGLRHLVVLSVVGADRLAAGDYFRGKLVQEAAAAQSGIPATLLRATQFFEFLPVIAAAGSGQGAVRVPDARVQPVAADDVAAALAEIAAGAPAQGVVELAGPEDLSLADALRRTLAATGDPRPVVSDPEARYFGVPLETRTLLPGTKARIASTRLDEWLAARVQRSAQ